MEEEIDPPSTRASTEDWKKALDRVVPCCVVLKYETETYSRFGCRWRSIGATLHVFVAPSSPAVTWNIFTCMQGHPNSSL